MASPARFLGSKISLISNSDIRYEGTLYTIDTEKSSVVLSNVKHFGTEDRRKDNPCPPSDKIYEFIIFRGTDIKDLTVCEPPPQAQAQAGVPHPQHQAQMGAPQMAGPHGGQQQGFGHPQHYQQGMPQYGHHPQQRAPQYQGYYGGFGGYGTSSYGMAFQQHPSHPMHQGGAHPGMMSQQDPSGPGSPAQHAAPTPQATPVQPATLASAPPQTAGPSQGQQSSATTSGETGPSAAGAEKPPASSFAAAVKGDAAKQPEAQAQPAGSAKAKTESAKASKPPAEVVVGDKADANQSKKGGKQAKQAMAKQGTGAGAHQGQQQDQQQGGKGSNKVRRGGGKGGSGTAPPAQKDLQPFDFEKANALFEKDKLKETTSTEAAEGDAADTPDSSQAQPAYSKDSFFDSISCDSLDKANQQGRGGRMTSHEQRKRDAETFGSTYVNNSNRNGITASGGTITTGETVIGTDETTAGVAEAAAAAAAEAAEAAEAGPRGGPRVMATIPVPATLRISAFLLLTGKGHNWT
eukprot:CAMPEP_0119119992 /NCGR_PEP_ID=MMETSP1310-20130426/1233_1 /TAXON_ID=464262 /ORGANISM="Genus nov. species nov., Strain RCC2339" /LENGTH=519 /DNA_ID=CAMNT_0007109455 /DNA_START=56 /DNA_END=1613 /DNA_ORIENTATION=+